MKSMLGQLTLALIPVLSGCALAPSSGGRLAGGRAATARFDDGEFLGRVQAAAAPLLDSAALRTGSALCDELDAPHATAAHTTAHLTLPAARTARIALPDLYQRGAGSVLVFCEIYQCDRCAEWHAAGCGTAFAIARNGICVACRHQFEHTEKKIRYLVLADREAHVFPIREILAASAADDLVVFRAEGLNAAALPLRTEIPVGSDVNLISHPNGRFYFLTRGIIARSCIIRGGMLHKTNDSSGPKIPYLQITADYGGGSSGAPVLDNSGNVVAVAQYCDPVHNEKGGTQMAVRTCVCAERIRKLLKTD